MMRRRYWNAAELDSLQALYPHRPTKEIAEQLGRDISSVYQQAAKLRLKKSAEFLASDLSGILRKGETRIEGVAHQFKKGQVPPNKGLRRPGWAPGRMRETQFKRGERTGAAARNWRPIGTILVDPEGYQRIKVRDALYGEHTGYGNTKVWPLLHRHMWEAVNGPAPEGFVVVFKDGNRANSVLENLELISRADLARRNQMWANMPRELAEVIQLNGALKRKLRRLNNGKEQNQ
jgi:hypothetical protein